MENLFTLAGRLLLAAYFFLPGVMKLADFEGTSGYMAAHGMVLIPVFLSLTIVMQIGGAVLLAVGYRVIDVEVPRVGLRGGIATRRLVHAVATIERKIRKRVSRCEPRRRGSGSVAMVKMRPPARLAFSTMASIRR